MKRKPCWWSILAKLAGKMSAMHTAAADSSSTGSDADASLNARESAAWFQHFEQGRERSARFHFAADALRSDFTQAMRRLVPNSARVLDVGCGRGDVLAALPNAVRHGIDFVEQTVHRAQRALPQCVFTVGDALTFELDQRFEAILCDQLCHTVPDVQQLLSNLVRHLAPAGRIFLTCLNGLLEPIFGAAEVIGAKTQTPPMNWLSETDLANLFRLTGLEIVRFEDRLLLPHTGLQPLNRFLGPLPGISRLTVHRIYVLRRIAEARKGPVSVSVVVPARNEAGNVEAILQRTPKMGSSTELIFVEGGSSDDTWEVIQRAARNYRGPLQVSAFQQPGRGKGDAVRTGFDRAKGDLLMILDADMTVPPEDLPKFYAAAVAGIGDYIHGTRMVYPMEGGAMRFLNRIGNVAFSRLFTFLLNQPIKDTLCGTKVIWRQDYRELAERRVLFGDFDPFGDFDLIFGAANLNLKLSEIPVRYRARTYGSTNISRFRHGLLLLRMSGVAARKLRFV